MTAPRIALVTGGNRGIGLAIAEELAQLGYSLALTARSAAALDAARERLEGPETRVVTVAADLRDPEAPQRIVDEVRDGLGPVDTIVNNAGTAPSDKLERTSDATLDEVLDLHVKAPFRLIRAVLPGMKERGSGCLIQLSSTAGLRGFALITAYTAAKHAMVGLTRALAVELARTAIRVYAVCPGFVDTEITRQGAAKVAALGKQSADDILQAYGRMNRSGRLLQPGGVAALVGALARPDCEVASGSIYSMDDMPPEIVEGPAR